MYTIFLLQLVIFNLKNDFGVKKIQFYFRRFFMSKVWRVSRIIGAPRQIRDGD